MAVLLRFPRRRMVLGMSIETRKTSMLPRALARAIVPSFRWSSLIAKSGARGANMKPAMLKSRSKATTRMYFRPAGLILGSQLPLVRDRRQKTRLLRENSL